MAVPAELIAGPFSEEKAPLRSCSVVAFCTWLCAWSTALRSVSKADLIWLGAELSRLSSRLAAAAVVGLMGATLGSAPGPARNAEPLGPDRATAVATGVHGA